LLTNGDFSNGSTDWALQANVTVSNGQLIMSNTTATLGARQNIAAVAGRWYEITYTISSITAGAVATRIGPTSQDIQRNTPGTYTERVLAVLSGIQQFIVIARGVTSAVIDNIFVRELLGNHAAQASPPSRPIFQTGPSRVAFDGVDDSHTTLFASSLGSACTVARAIPGVGAQILTSQTIGTSFTNTTTHAGMVVINRALTSTETASLTGWLNRAAGV
jgi:hypothetical protein